MTLGPAQTRAAIDEKRAAGVDVQIDLVTEKDAAIACDRLAAAGQAEGGHGAEIEPPRTVCPGLGRAADTGTEHDQEQGPV